jgi:hypothetical protein
MSHPVVLANAMGQSHSKETKSYSHLQEIPHIIRSRKVYYHVDNTHLLFPHTHTHTRLYSKTNEQHSFLPTIFQDQLQYNFFT